MHNACPYFSLKNVGRSVHIIHGKLWYLPSISPNSRVGSILKDLEVPIQVLLRWQTLYCLLKLIISSIGILLAINSAYSYCIWCICVCWFSLDYKHFF